MSIVHLKLKSKYLKIQFLGISLHVKPGSLYRFIVKTILAFRMKKKIRRLQQKDKIRVGFLVAESSKWGYQSVFDAFASDSRFEPVIMTTKLAIEHKTGATYYKTMADCKEFFKKKGMPVISAYNEENNSYIPLNELDVDIVFYEQPWELADCQHPIHVSKYAITCYSSYGFDLVAWNGAYKEDFHRFLDVYFTVSEANKDYILKVCKAANNVCIVGNPKLDVFMNPINSEESKKIIIYAPHHSFEEHSLNLATFQYNGQFILDFAKKHAEKFYWCFKPHPRLKHALITNKIMTEEQVNAYYEQWNTIGEICDGGDYFELFQKSAALITDCCSFLGEYLPTEKPVMHLINTRAQFNDVAKSFIGTYYQIYDNKQLLQEFERVLVKCDDYKKQDRLKKIGLIFDKNQRTADKIFCSINNMIGGV